MRSVSHCCCHGNLSGEDAAKQVLQDIARTSGIINAGIGGLEIAGVTICSAASAGACYLAVAGAVLGTNRTIGGVSEVITGQEQLTPAEWSAIQAGMKPEDAKQLIGWLETGVATVTIIHSVAVIAKGGTVITAKKVAENSAGRNGSSVGSVGDANFAQTSIRSDRAFSPDGQQIYSDLAGYQIRTVDDLSRALRRGDISPADVPVDFVDMNGSRLILNTRTSTALQDAGIPQNQWYGTQRTGQTAYIDAAGNPVTYNDLAVNQLNNNNLPPTGSPTLPSGQ